jgi:hypothetical protein
MSNLVLAERVDEGVFRKNKTIVTVHAGTIGVAEIKPSMKMYCGDMPDEVFLARAVPAPALADRDLVLEMYQMISDLLLLSFTAEHAWHESDYARRMQISERNDEILALLEETDPDVQTVHEGQ